MISAGDKLRCQDVQSYGNDPFADSAARLIAGTLQPSTVSGIDPRDFGNCVLAGDALYQSTTWWPDGTVFVNGTYEKVDFDLCDQFANVCSVLKNYESIFKNQRLVHALGVLGKSLTVDLGRLPADFLADLKKRIDEYQKKTTCDSSPAEAILEVLTPTNESHLEHIDSYSVLGRMIHTYYYIKHPLAKPEEQLAKLLTLALFCKENSTKFDDIQQYLLQRIPYAITTAQAAIDAAKGPQCRADQVVDGTGCKCKDAGKVDNGTACACPPDKVPSKKDATKCVPKRTGGGRSQRVGGDNSQAKSGGSIWTRDPGEGR